MTTNPHILVVDDDGRLTIECPAVTDACRTWVEADCPEASERDEWDGDTWFGWAGEDTAHGVTHAYIDGAWSHPTDDCWLQIYPDLSGTAADLRPLLPGRHAVTHEYDCGGEGHFTLALADVAAHR